MYRIQSLAFCVLLLLPRVALAQACGSVPAAVAEETKQAVAPIFFDSAEADIREDYVRQLAPGELQEIVRDDSVCTPVVQRAIAHMRATNTIWNALQEGDHEITVFRFGPYYAVSLARAQTSEGTGLNVTTGWSPLVVFREGDLAYVHTFTRSLTSSPGLAQKQR